MGEEEGKVADSLGLTTPSVNGVLSTCRVKMHPAPAFSKISLQNHD